MKRLLEAPILRMGFRPLFWLGSVYSIVMMVYWVGGLEGWWTMSANLNLVNVHIHEMVFGFVAAIVGGFLLTASANWTRTRGLHGGPLLLVVSFWLLGRVGMLLVLLGFHPIWICLDFAFLPSVMVAIAPSLWKARKPSNLFPLLWLTVMASGNILFLLDASWVWVGWGRRGLFLGLYAVVMLMVLIGGRVLPFFTKNFIQDPAIRKWPLMDVLGLAATAAFVFTAFVFGETHPMTGSFAGTAGVIHLLRMRYWGTLRTWKTPILWVLHLAYLWVVAGFLLHSAAVRGWLPWSMAVHAFTVGGMGCFILGMISRVSLGHTGRPLQAAPVIVAAYATLLVAAAVRVLTPLLPAGAFHVCIAAAGVGWVLAYGLFVAVYTPILWSARADGKDG